MHLLRDTSVVRGLVTKDMNRGTREASLTFGGLITTNYCLTQIVTKLM